MELSPAVFTVPVHVRNLGHFSPLSNFPLFASLQLPFRKGFRLLLNFRLTLTSRVEN
jgi:hypothetical protein